VKEIHSVTHVCVVVNFVRAIVPVGVTSSVVGVLSTSWITRISWPAARGEGARGKAEEVGRLSPWASPLGRAAVTEAARRARSVLAIMVRDDRSDLFGDPSKWSSRGDTYTPPWKDELCTLKRKGESAASTS